MRRPTRRSRRACWRGAASACGRSAHRSARHGGLIEAHPAPRGGLGGIEDFLHAYSLSTKEGLALMVLAEALLRVPDAATADRLIEDKLAIGDWSSRRCEVAHAPGLGLGLDARHHRPHHPSGRDARQHPRRPDQAARPAGGAHRDPPGDAAARLAFRARPDHRGGARAAPHASTRATPSTCWARAPAPRPMRSAIFPAYASAIDAIGARAGDARAAGAARHLGQAVGAASALRGGVARARARRAGAATSSISPARPSDHDLNFTVDAEEADRLELSLEVIAAMLAGSVAARLGRLWARGAGLSEARAAR